MGGYFCDRKLLYRHFFWIYAIAFKSSGEKAPLPQINSIWYGGFEPVKGSHINIVELGWKDKSYRGLRWAKSPKHCVSYVAMTPNAPEFDATSSSPRT